MTFRPIQDPERARALDWTFKGLAPNWPGLSAAQIGAAHVSLFDDAIMLPTAVLKRSVLESNRAWMRNFLALTGVRIAPHGKTTLAPELFRQQAEDGAWAITAATAHHVRLYRAFGVSRIFMANQLVGAANIDWVMGELNRDPDFDFYTLVDSAEGAHALAEGVARNSGRRPLQILVEMGKPGGRCGVRSVAEGLALARVINACAPGLRLVGVETFEGISQLAPDAASLAKAILDEAVGLAKACIGEDLLPRQGFLLSAGGSGLFDLAARTFLDAELHCDIVLRSGCYITHDDGAYGRLFKALRQRMPEVDRLGEGLKGALQVWAHVQSLPEPGIVVCGFGRRDAGTETDWPRAVAWARPHERAIRPAPPELEISAMFDQHTVLSAPLTHELKLGDMIGFGVSHPCTTFDKWRSLLVVDDDYVVRDVVRTYF